jgi:hypothetical protein
MLRVFEDLKANLYLPADTTANPHFSLDHIDGKYQVNNKGIIELIQPLVL